MTTTTLEQIERLVDELTPLGQVQLLEYLTPRISRALAAVTASQPMTPPSDPWREFFRIGDSVAATDNPDMDTLTATVLAMRR
jgi:hypothetical protein